ncbi:hypothetical protein BaRGS_00005542 [Batillaria attramentaria]|uniref:Uncharacterized protein n=1 Tax=Batillaria attramentaria TaxID=370345 RepID=A0ABD0LWC7_9CAEN
MAADSRTNRISDAPRRLLSGRPRTVEAVKQQNPVTCQCTTCFQTTPSFPTLTQHGSAVIRASQNGTQTLWLCLGDVRSLFSGALISPRKTGMRAESFGDVWRAHTSTTSLSTLGAAGCSSFIVNIELAHSETILKNEIALHYS